jgi:phosphoglycolate phosphatase
MKPKALIFDLDGTLVDSLPDLAAAANRLLAELDRPPLDTTAIAAMIGDGVGKLVERALRAQGVVSPPPLPALVARFVGFYEADIASRTRPYPGVVDGLAALAEQGVALALCTNKLRHATAAVLTALDLARFFAVVVSGDSLPRQKPDPAPLRFALERLGIAAAEAAMLGDHRNDVLAARATGSAALFARYGYGLASLGDVTPDAMIDRFDELPGVLKEFQFSLIRPQSPDP